MGEITLKLRDKIEKLGTILKLTGIVKDSANNIILSKRYKLQYYIIST